MALFMTDWNALDSDNSDSQTYYRKIELYNMAWGPSTDVGTSILAAAQYGGPVAVAKVSSLPSNKPVIFIYTASGKELGIIKCEKVSCTDVFSLLAPLSSPFHQWSSGKLLSMGWSNCEELLCIQDDGHVLLHDLFGNYLSTFSMGNMSDRPRLTPLKLSRAISKDIEEISEIISSCNLADCDLTKLNHHAFAAAITIHQKWQRPEKTSPIPEKCPSSIPPWKRRLPNWIGTARRDLCTLQEIKKGNTTWKVKLTYKKCEDEDPSLGPEDKAVCEKGNYFQHNEHFTNNQKLFYRELRAKPIEVKKIPDKAELEEFWSNIMECSVSHNVNATWLQRQRELTDIPDMSDPQNTTSDLKKGLIQTANWKSP
ncbi:unnamed protein product, partial [Darwinula stevensoni]